MKFFLGSINIVTSFVFVGLLVFDQYIMIKSVPQSIY